MGEIVVEMGRECGEPGLDRVIGGPAAARKAGGVYYTPPEIVAYIVARTVGPLLAGKTPAEAAALRILDPACGSGLFLLEAYRYLLDWYAAQAAGPLPLEQRAAILRTQIYGVDIDPQAVALARLALARLATAGQGVRRPLPDLSATIRCGNALTGPDFAGGDDGARGEGLDWGAAFPAARQAGGFDAVIGNPPWVSLNGKFGNAVYSAAERAALVRRYGGDTYRPNVYEYFIRRAVALTRPGGYQAFLVPDRLAANAQFARLRGELLAGGAFAALLTGARFPGVRADTLVYIYRPGVAPAAPGVMVGAFGGACRHVPQAGFLAAPDQALLPVPPLIGRLYAPTPSRAPLGTVVTSGVGFIAQAGIVYDMPGAGRQPVLRGRHIGRYATVGESYFVFEHGNLAGGTHDPDKLGAVPKILLRKTGLPLAATLDTTGRYPEQSLYLLCRPTQGLDLAYILGILNSRLFQYVYAAWLVTNRTSTPQLKKIHLDRFPLRLIDFADPADATRHADLAALVRRMLILQEDHSAPQEIAALDAAIDRQVYALYGLAPDEITVIETGTRSADRL